MPNHGTRSPSEETFFSFAGWHDGRGGRKCIDRSHTESASARVLPQTPNGV